MASARRSNAQRRPSPEPAAKERTPDVPTVAKVSGNPAGPRVVPVPSVVPDPEVRERAARRHFTAEYKVRLLRDADGASPGELGALLRREGLYSSHLTTWRRQRDAGALRALSPKKRGRPAAPPSPLARRVAELEREKARLERRLQQAETIIDVQKKLSTMLGIPLAAGDATESGS